MSYRLPLARWIDRGPPLVECLEVTAEHFYLAGAGRLRGLARRLPVLVHTSRLSLGTPGPLDEGELRLLEGVVEIADPLWVGEPLGFRRSVELDLGQPAPVRLTPETLRLLVDHCRQAAARLGRPLLIENIAHALRVRSPLGEAEFLSRLAVESGCGLALDLAALAAQARSHGFDARAWLRDLALDRVVQLRVGGYEPADGRWIDTRRDPVPEDVWALAAEVLAATPVRVAILAREGRFPDADDLEAEMDRLRQLATTAGRRAPDGGPGRP